MAIRGIPVNDADNHFYETRDAFTKFLPDAYKGAIKYVEVDGRTKIAVRNVISDYIPNPTFDVVARPGAQEEYFRHGNAQGKSRREIFGEPMKAIPAFREPRARLEVLDELGIDRTLIFPTLASLLEERMRDAPELTHVVIHALNEWMHETWQFNYEDRIFAAPVITLPIVEKAVEEIEWVAARGARVVLIRPAPVPGFKGPRSFALPEFDPVWDAITRHDLLVAMHSSDSGYSRFYGEWVGSQDEMLPFKPNAMAMAWSWRPVQDAVTAWIIDGALTRFPTLKLSFIENGCSWIGPLMRELKGIYKKMPTEFPEDPVEVMKRAIHVSPFWEDDFGEIAALLGEDNVLFGSDWPHPEGLAHPKTAVDELLEQFPEETVKKFMGGNLARLLGVPASAV